MQKRDIGYLIKSIHDKLKAKADADLKHYPLTLAQSRMLAFLPASKRCWPRFPGKISSACGKCC